MMSEVAELNIEVSSGADHVAMSVRSGGVAIQVVMTLETAGALAEVLARAASGQEVDDEE
ncbi:hypothetical protein [Devosia elaeis]|uniref:hypothetical protein n=1 Tax=Devosia elaeis TaxID=1770058 RepID=UPI000AF74242|nr:hypothetical protein [Devosia elaeis]